MEIRKINKDLEFHWQTGYLYGLRYKTFNKQLGQDLLDLLRSISVSGSTISRVLGKWIWPIPLFLEYRLQEFSDENVLKGDGLIFFKYLVGEMTEETCRLLG